jgi:hypothetical protein
MAEMANTAGRIAAIANINGDIQLISDVARSAGYTGFP